MQLKLIWLFVGILFILVPFSQKPGRALFTAKFMLFYIPFIISIVGCIDSIKRLKHFLYFLMIIMIYIALYMLTHKGKGPGSYFADENDVSLFLDMLLPYGYFLFIQEKNKWLKIFLGVGLFLCIGAVVVSFSRGGFLGLIAASAVIWLFSPRKIVTLLILAVLGTGMYLFSGKAASLGTSRGRGGSYWNEMGTFTDTKENTAAARIRYWQASIKMFKTFPLGVGAGCFPYLHQAFQPDEWHGLSQWGVPAHSIWFTLLPETGIEGVLVFLILIGVNLKSIFSIKNISKNRADPDDKFLYYLSIAFLSSFAGFFTAGSFIAVLYYAHYWYFSGLVAASTNIAYQRSLQQVYALEENTL
jgi:hypothetical protein